eukprot:1159363-Pelagomonas_calceolata.AAC.4
MSNCSSLHIHMHMHKVCISCVRVWDCRLVKVCAGAMPLGRTISAGVLPLGRKKYVDAAPLGLGLGLAGPGTQSHVLLNTPCIGGCNLLWAGYLRSFGQVHSAR